MGKVCGPHTGVGTEVRDVLVSEELLLERGDDLTLEQLTRSREPLRPAPTWTAVTTSVAR